MFRQHRQRNQDIVHRGSFPNPVNQSICMGHVSRRASKDYHYDERYEPAEEQGRMLRPDQGHRKPLPRVAFEDAVNELFGALAETLDFYAWFKRRYDEDIRSIRSYASPPILAELWNQKSSALGSHREVRDGTDHAPQSSSGRMTFKTAFLQLQDAFELVLRSSHDAPSRDRNSHDNGFDRASLRRLVTKLQGAREDIPKLAKGAVKRVGDAEALITELELMSGYLEKSRAVWRKERNGDGRHGEARGRKREERYDERDSGNPDQPYNQRDGEMQDQQEQPMEDDMVNQEQDNTYQEPTAEGKGDAW